MDEKVGEPVLTFFRTCLSFSLNLSVFFPELVRFFRRTFNLEDTTISTFINRQEQYNIL